MEFSRLPVGELKIHRALVGRSQNCIETFYPKNNLKNMHISVKIFCLTAILATSVLYNVAHAQKQLESNYPESNYYVAAYIWPSCHDDPLAREKLWKEGIGEWEVIKNRFTENTAKRSRIM
jgi:hypothetical protein